MQHRTASPRDVAQSASVPSLRRPEEEQEGHFGRLRQAAAQHKEARLRELKGGMQGAEEESPERLEYGVPEEAESGNVGCSQTP